MNVVKDVRPKEPVAYKAIQLGQTFEGLKEALTEVASGLPIMIVEAAQPQGSTGVALQLRHEKEGWSLLVQSGDWIVFDTMGHIEVYDEKFFPEHFLTVEYSN